MIAQSVYAILAVSIGVVCGLFIASNINYFPRKIMAQFEPEALTGLTEINKLGKVVMSFSVGLLWGTCAFKFGQDVKAGCWAVFGTVLIMLATIDARTFLLPDDLTQPLVWCGLLASCFGWIDTPLNQAVIGASIAYASLWSIATGYYLLTGREGMGGGDIKLLAAIGAWLGPLVLIQVVLIASMLGAIGGIAMKLLDRQGEHGEFPFGPYLAIGAFVSSWSGLVIMENFI